MTAQRWSTCFKICWELVEQQAKTIKKLSVRIKELEALLDAGP